MTTLAYKNGVLAVDSQITDFGTVRLDKPKLYVFEGLGAIAFAGNAMCYANVARWLFNGCKGMKPGAGGGSDASWAAYYLTQGGLLFLATDDLMLQALDRDQFEADGSGTAIARTAMYLGKDADDAVRTAIELDPHTGGEVSWYDSSTGKYRNAIVMTLDDLQDVESKLPPSPFEPQAQINPAYEE